MARSRKLTWQDAPNLKIGDQLFYSAGLDDHHCEAWVSVAKEGGTTGVMVTVETIATQGSESLVVVGDTICAGFDELEITILAK